MNRLISTLKQALLGESSDDRLTRKAVVTGSITAGALVTSLVLRSMRRKPRPVDQLLPALKANVHDMEIMEGRYRFYAREGTGVPIVLLHGIGVAASSFEMKPLFEHFCSVTTRPVFAVDWIGFGLSDRPAVPYRPSVFHRQLRRFLSERIHQPADVVALSLGCEFAAVTSRSHPFLFRRLIFISPTGLSSEGYYRPMRRSAVHAAQAAGIFEAVFERIATDDALRRHYQRAVFGDERLIPPELLAYASQTCRVEGAHHAVAAFLSGDLFSHDVAFDAYSSVSMPVLLTVPVNAQNLSRSFDLLSEVKMRNPDHLRILRARGGTMPHWTRPEEVLDAVTSFLTIPDPLTAFDN
ncbi:MAG: alpha/beta fold hydrolase [Rhodothermales bacterium]